MKRLDAEKQRATEKAEEAEQAQDNANANNDNSNGNDMAIEDDPEKHKGGGQDNNATGGGSGEGSTSAVEAGREERSAAEAGVVERNGEEQEGLKEDPKRIDADPMVVSEESAVPAGTENSTEKGDGTDFADAAHVATLVAKAMATSTLESNVACTLFCPPYP